MLGQNTNIIGDITIVNEYCLEYCPVAFHAIDKLGGVQNIISSLPAGELVSSVLPIDTIMDVKSWFTGLMNSYQGHAEHIYDGPTQDPLDVDMIIRASLLMDTLLCDNCSIVNLNPRSVDVEVVIAKLAHIPQQEHSLDMLADVFNQFYELTDELTSSLPLLEPLTKHM